MFGLPVSGLNGLKLIIGKGSNNNYTVIFPDEIEEVIISLSPFRPLTGRPNIFALIY